MSSFVYRSHKVRMADGSFAGWTTADLRALLVTDAYTPDQDAHAFVSDVDTTESSSAGRTAVENPVIRTEAGGVVELDLDDPYFVNVAVGETASGAILYVRVGADDSTPEDDHLVAFIDGDDIPTNGSDVQVQISADGALKL